VLIFNTVFNVMFMLCFFVRVEREESANDELRIIFFSDLFWFELSVESGFFSEKERKTTNDKRIITKTTTVFL
tara:strand:- start:3268 stop:3486 length:219 start_codon:yes stop_codon:yes gene_type:complete